MLHAFAIRHTAEWKSRLVFFSTWHFVVLQNDTSVSQNSIENILDAAVLVRPAWRQAESAYLLVQTPVEIGCLSLTARQLGPAHRGRFKKLFCGASRLLDRAAKKRVLAKTLNDFRYGRFRIVLFARLLD